MTPPAATVVEYDGKPVSGSVKGGVIVGGVLFVPPERVGQAINTACIALKICATNCPHL